MEDSIREITYAEAINEALIQEMSINPAIFVYGIGVPDHKKVFGTTKDLDSLYPSRCLDTPLSEAALTGFGIGAAIRGLRPVQIHIRMDFMLLALNQLVNMAATHHYISGQPVPFVIRGIVGRGWGQGCHHSKSLHGMFSGIPGLVVGMPSSPRDAKGMLTRALRGLDPTLLIEHRWLYWAKGNVPEGSYETPYTSSFIRRGSDVTIVATSWMVVEAIRAAEVMSERGVEIEIIDLRWSNPLTEDIMGNIILSVEKTKGLIIADNDWMQYGISAEVFTSLAMSGIVPKTISRTGQRSSPCPTARHLEDKYYPGAKEVIRAVEFALDLEPMSIDGVFDYSHENKFRGPF